MTTLIEQLASAKGIANEYVDAWGSPAQVSLDSKAAMLGAMGYRIDDETALAAQLQAEQQAHWQRPLDPVCVIRSHEVLSVEIVCRLNRLMTSLPGLLKPKRAWSSRAASFRLTAKW